jgi:death-on-curing protein
LLGVDAVRDVGLLGSAAARPATTLGGHDAYPDLAEKAAALLQSIVTNHPLVDGNKRLGWLAAATFVELNDASVLSASNDAVVDLVVLVADGRRDVPAITAALRKWML